MREELKKITLELQKWSKKYNKNFVSVSSIDFTGMAFIDAEDKDYEKLNILIKNNEAEECE